jgi:hypothetical protein
VDVEAIVESDAEGDESNVGMGRWVVKRGLTGPQRRLSRTEDAFLRGEVVLGGDGIIPDWPGETDRDDGEVGGESEFSGSDTVAVRGAVCAAASEEDVDEMEGADSAVPRSLVPSSARLLLFSFFFSRRLCRSSS